MIKELGKKILETVLSILPLVVIISVLFLINLIPGFLVTSDGGKIISNEIFFTFLVCSLFLVIGSAIFQFGADNALSKVGHYIGQDITKRKSIGMLVIIAFLLGLLITIAEPDLSLLTDQLKHSINPWVIKGAIGIGVGIFLALGLMRILLQKSIKLYFILCYFLVFAIGTLFGPSIEQGAFIALSFDSSGVTTGPATVPFVVAFGVSVASTRGGRDSSEDSFGVTGIMSIGPILAMLFIGLFLKNDTVLEPVPTVIIDLMGYVKETLSEEIMVVLLGVLPIMFVFYIYNFLFLKLDKKILLKTLVGFINSMIGLYLFIAAAKIGFIPLGNALGQNIAGNPDIHFVLVLVVLVLGIFIVFAEPSVEILSKQVEEISNGVITRKSIYAFLAVGVSSAVTLEILRILYWDSFSIVYYFVLFFILAIVLVPFTPEVYVAIAFDSGGVASGVLASSFILPMVIGVSEVMNKVNSNATSGFGVIGMIALFPIVSIEILGISANVKVHILQKIARRRLVIDENDIQIIHFGDIK